jgi:hypothetical protein
VGKKRCEGFGFEMAIKDRILAKIEKQKSKKGKIKEKEIDPHLKSVIERIKEVYEEGTEDQRIIIETLVDSLIERNRRLGVTKKKA